MNEAERKGKRPNVSFVIGVYLLEKTTEEILKIGTLKRGTAMNKSFNASGKSEEIKRLNTESSVAHVNPNSSLLLANIYNNTDFPNKIRPSFKPNARGN